MKKILKHFIILLSSLFNGYFAGKIISCLDFCRVIICNNTKTFAGQVHERMDINKIIPQNYKDHTSKSKIIETTDKLKVRIVYPGGCAWNHIHSMYEAFASDEKFQTYVVVRDAIEYTNILNKYSCNYIKYSNYNIIDDKPDIFIATFYSSYDKEIIFSGCKKYIGMVFAEIPNVVMNEKNDEIHWEYISRAYKYLPPDYWIADPLVYNSLLKFIDKSKIINIGSPQFDELYHVIGLRHKAPESWGKLNKLKKVFLWATDHGINESHPTNGFTIDLYFSKMIKYFNEHSDIGLIFRPHPEFVRELGRNGHFWSIDDINKIKKYMESTPNIIWDDTHDYCCAYDLCNALIVDANCSITCSFLITGKPICRLLRTDINEWLISPELSDCYYYAHGFNECINFIEMIREGNDPKIDDRKEGCKLAIPNFDGKNGERIKNFIISKYNAKNI